MLNVLIMGGYGTFNIHQAYFSVRYKWAVVDELRRRGPHPHWTQHYVLGPYNEPELKNGECVLNIEQYPESEA